MMVTRRLLANVRLLLAMGAVCLAAQAASGQVPDGLVLPTSSSEVVTTGQNIHEVPASLRLAVDTRSVAFPSEPSSNSAETSEADDTREKVLSDWDAGDDAMFSTSALQAQLRKLAWGTVTVLALCVGFLVISKRWLPGKLPAKQTPHLQHLASLQLPNRCTVQLVEAEGCRVLVGTDASGVKMIVPLQAAFWEHVDETQAEQTHAASETETLSTASTPPQSTFDLASVKASFQQLLSSRESST